MAEFKCKGFSNFFTKEAIFVSELQLYLPDKEELRALIEKQLNKDEEN